MTALKWHVHPTKPRLILDGEQRLVAIATATDPAPARLILQAPSMAKLLAASEWKGPERTCISCGGFGGRGGHLADCELAAVLDAAGVRR